MATMRFFSTKYFFLFSFLACSVQLFAQPQNDECISAILLTDLDSWCSSVGAFNNIDATNPGGLAPAGCFSGDGGDVWFRFVNGAPAVSINVIGQLSSGGGGGTLNNPEVAIYTTSDCNNFSAFGVACESDVNNFGNVTLNTAGLTIGQTYYIRVQGRNQGQGTFQLCINNFFPPADPGSDCNTSAILCDKTPFVVERIEGAGLDNDEAAGTCLGTFGVSESSSTWFKWTAANNGTLEFTLTPTILTDDLDFVIFELPNGINDCEGKFSVRCNATFGGNNADCGPLTGLNASSSDLEEDSNCDAGEDGFLAALDMVEGTSYAMLVNNFSNSGGGFEIEWGGTGEFLGPLANFNFQVTGDVLECDKTVRFIDSSFFDNGNITDWQWNFGVDAMPQSATGPGPHEITYNSFGEKSIVLTVESDLGCIVSEVLTVFVEPCCEDLPDPQIVLDSLADLICADINSGYIEVSGTNSMFEPFQYSFEGGPFTQIPIFTNLAAGDYTIVITDQKGCMNSSTFTITAPPPLTVNAGRDTITDLGVPIMLNASYNPPVNITAQWTTSSGSMIINDTTLNPSVNPVEDPSVFVIEITDDEGCTALDSVLVRINEVKPVFIPNAFSPNGDFINDMFTVFAGPAVDMIEELRVFNRWGDLVFSRDEFLPNDESVGWDGNFNGRKLNAGVFVYYAKVRFINRETQIYKGDINLIR
ncbi:MAG: gliding motility-associated C-terminal domain-containing protein [Bacteroidota bacterium]